MIELTLKVFIRHNIVKLTAKCMHIEASTIKFIVLFRFILLFTRLLIDH